MNSNTYYIFIHGGKSDLQRLKREVPFLSLSELDAESDKIDKGWSLYFKNRLKEGSKKPVCVLMPYPDEAIYEEWEECLNNVFKQMLISTDVYIIGHSLGALCLQMYLAKNKIKQNVKQVHFVAPCINEGVFVASPNWGNILNTCSNIHIWHSTDDNVVSYKDGVKYNTMLMGSTMHTLREKGHISGKEFKELVDFLLD